MKALDQSLGRTIAGINTQESSRSRGVFLIDLTLDDGSSLLIRGDGLSAELKRPTPKPLTLRERLSGKVQL
jgi:hypothetical protein